MIHALAIAAGTVGAVLRLVIAGAVQRRLATEWPWGTATVNALGALGVGVVVGVDPGPTTTAMLVGALAGFTTFSTWMVEAAALWSEGGGGHRRAVIDMLVPALVGIGLVILGLTVGRAL